MNLQDIEQEILTLHASLNVRSTLERARRIGQLLQAVKAQLPHGEYGPWLDRIGLNRRTASNYIRVAKAPIEQGTADLGIEAFLTTLRAGRKAERLEQAQAMASGPPTADSSIVTDDSFHWMAGQKSDSVPFIVTDPPFGIGLTYDGWRETDAPEAYWDWFRPYWQEMQRIVVPGGSVLIWQSYQYLAHFPTWFPGAKFVAHCQVLRGRPFWEPILLWQKPGKPLVPHTTTTDWFVGSQSSKAHDPFAALHPCVKPVPDCQIVVKRYTLPGSLVVDPFCGTGAICLAAKLEGRAYLGIERSARFADLARRRVSGNQNLGN